MPPKEAWWLWTNRAGCVCQSKQLTWSCPCGCIFNGLFVMRNDVMDIAKQTYMDDPARALQWLPILMLWFMPTAIMLTTAHINEACVSTTSLSIQLQRSNVPIQCTNELDLYLLGMYSMHSAFFWNECWRRQWLCLGHEQRSSFFFGHVSTCSVGRATGTRVKLNRRWFQSIWNEKYQSNWIV